MEQVIEKTNSGSHYVKVAYFRYNDPEYSNNSYSTYFFDNLQDAVIEYSNRLESFGEGYNCDTMFIELVNPTTTNEKHNTKIKDVLINWTI